MIRNVQEKYLKSPLRYKFWQIFGKRCLDEQILDLFSGAHTGEITTFQNVYLRGDSRYGKFKKFVISTCAHPTYYS